MPFAIALETSGRCGSLAIVDGETILPEITFPHGLQHAATILPALDNAVRAAGRRPGDIEHVYLSAGPGSFTGLRIAVTLAKTLAMSIGAKIVAIESTRVLAENAPAEARRVVIVLDAKRGQVFTASYERSGERDDWLETQSPHLNTIADVIARSGRPVHLIGEGIPYHRNAIPTDEGIIVIDESNWRARATVVANIGRRRAAAGHFAYPATLTPIYIRLPEAEEKRLASEGEMGIDRQ